MKNPVLVLFLLSISLFSHGQLIKGKIVDDATGVPMHDATIEVSGVGNGTHSGNDGRFSVKLSPGKHILEFRYVGYKTAQREVTLATGETVSWQVRLIREVYEQEQIVVTAGKLEMNRDIVPMNISVITQKEINESSATNVLPVLSTKIPGLFVTQRGSTGFGLAAGSAGKISIRGVGGTDASFPVLVLIDGQPQFMGLMGHPLPDTYVTSDVEKVEVVKGPASVLYGTSAMGGAINLITRRQKEEGFSLRGRMSYGSFDTRKAALTGGYRHERFYITTSLNHDDTDGDRPGSDFRINNGYLAAGYRISDHFSVDANVSQSYFKAYDPGPVTAPFALKSHWVDIARTSSYLTLSNKFDRSEGGIKAYYMFGDHDIYDGWKSADHNRGISLYQGWRLFAGNLLSAGFDLKKYGGKGTSPVLGNVSGKSLEVDEAGGYLIVQQTLAEKLTLNAGLRYDHHSVFGGTWVPQGGASWQVNNLTTLRAMVSKGFRNPTIRDLYLFPPANPNLEPESMWNYEISLAREFAGKRGEVELTAYLANGENLIISAPNPTPPPPFKNQNTGHFSHAGLEAEVRYRLTDGWDIQAAYSFLDMDVPKTGVPEQQLYIGTNFRRGAFEWNLNMESIRDLYLQTSNLQNPVRNSYTLLNTKVAYRLSSQFQLFVSGDNLLNQKYQVQFGYPMPGATFFTGINFSL